MATPRRQAKTASPTRSALSPQVVGAVHATLQRVVRLRTRLEYVEQHQHELQRMLSSLRNAKFYRVISLVTLLQRGVRKVGRKIRYLPFSFPVAVVRSFIHKMYLRIVLRKNVDIVVFGIISYKYRRQRPQHLAERLAAKGYRVFYIENGFIPVKGSIGIGDQPPFYVSQFKRNLYLVSLAATRDISIYKEAASTEDLKLILSSFEQVKKKLKISTYVSVVEHPFWAQVAPNTYSPLVYDCMDEHIGFKDTTTTIAHFEELLIQKSDAVVVTSDYLYAKMKRKRVKQIHVVKNAGDYRYFSQVGKTTFTPPIEYAQIQGPIIGYFGAISEWFDASIIARLADAFPACSIVLIGEVRNAKIEDVSRRHKNVIILGEKPYDALLPYLEKFDVCLIPFRVIPLTKATNPVKIFEYFATGKPVVSTALPELKEFKDSVYLAKNAEDFVRLTKIALDEQSQQKAETRKTIARNNTWKQRADAFEAVVKEEARKFYA